MVRYSCVPAFNRRAVTDNLLPIALQTAAALAEYDAEKDEEGKILITDVHLKAVVELSADFKTYLNNLHLGDEAKRAERKFERLDDRVKTPSKA